jgi:hypothetical protein
LWNKKNPSTQQMIPAIFKREGINFNSQKAFLVPCVVQPQKDGDVDGVPLDTMMQGVGDDLTFHGNSAFKCSQKRMAKCCSALTVRLRSSSLSSVV